MYSRSRHHRHSSHHRRNHGRKRKYKSPSESSYSSRSRSRSRSSCSRTRSRSLSRSTSSAYTNSSSSPHRQRESRKHRDYSPRHRRRREVRKRTHKRKERACSRSVDEVARYPRGTTPRKSSKNCTQQVSDARYPSDLDSNPDLGEPRSETIEAHGSSKNLDSETLKLLGEDNSKVITGPAIHEALSERWTEILKSGMDKEIKEGLLKKYLVPSNCPLLNAPIINAEVKSVMTSVALKKDKYNQSRQQQLGAGISAIGTALSAVLNFEGGQDIANLKATIIEHVGDGTRLLVDSFYDLSIIRRSYIIPGLNLTAKSVAEQCNVDEYLFGKDFTEKHKSAMAVEKDARSLTKPSTSSYRKPTTRFDAEKPSYTPHARTNNAALNSKAPPKRNQKAYRLGGNQKQRSQPTRPYQRTRR